MKQVIAQATNSDPYPEGLISGINFFTTQNGLYVVSSVVSPKVQTSKQIVELSTLDVARCLEPHGIFDFCRERRALMIYTENDTFFGPALSKRLYEAWTEAGGTAEYHLLAPFKKDGHFLVDDPDSVPLWSPIVMYS
jgi:hypothetical protein